MMKIAEGEPSQQHSVDGDETAGKIAKTAVESEEGRAAAGRCLGRRKQSPLLPTVKKEQGKGADQPHAAGNVQVAGAKKPSSSFVDLLLLARLIWRFIGSV